MIDEQVRSARATQRILPRMPQALAVPAGAPIALTLPLTLTFTLTLALSLLAAGCSTTAVAPVPPPVAANAPAGVKPQAPALAPTPAPSVPSTPPTTRRPGAFYLDDGPGSEDAAELARLAQLPDPEPVHEPLHPRANRPYRALGNDYQPMTRRVAFRQRGVASWYGKRYHGQPTSTGERYDMYRMTAAHPTMPLPSYLRVTNLDNGRSVVVRVNDRGPFLHDRAIDLSYLAAYKLDYLKSGSAPVQIELLEPGKPAPPASAVVGSAFVGAVERPTPPPAQASAAAPLQTSAAAPPSSPAHYLQFGAFKMRENAEAALVRLQSDRQALAAPLTIVNDEGLFRVRAGPYAQREQAARAAAAISAADASTRHGLRPLLVSR